MLLQTGSATDKAAFGNEQDFFGQHVADLTHVGYKQCDHLLDPGLRAGQQRRQRLVHDRRRQ